MHGTPTFHSIFSLVMYVSIVDLALFCLDTKKYGRNFGRKEVVILVVKCRRHDNLFSVDRILQSVFS